MSVQLKTVNLDPRVAAGAALWRPAETIVAVAAGGQHNLLLTQAGTVLASGSNERGQTDVPRGLRNVTAIAAGYAHSLALRRDGTVVAWGNNTRGAIDVPAGLADVVAVSAGGGHSAAVRRDGTVVAWGQLGFGPLDPPDDLDDAASIASGWECCFAVRSDGTMSAWGETQFGVPKVPDDLTGVIGVDGGGGPEPSWVAVKEDGTVVVRGHFGSAPLAKLTDVVEVTAGEMHVLARRRNGKLIGWGTSPVRHTVPKRLRDVVAVSAGNDHSIALRSDGTVIAWGKNGYKQLLGPADSTSELVGWEEDGYYLPSLIGRGKDPYEETYGRRAESASPAPRPPITPEPVARSTDDLRRRLVSAIDRAAAVQEGDFVEIGGASIEAVNAVHAYFYGVPNPDKQLWRDIFRRLWTRGYWAGRSQNVILSKLVEVAGRLGWTSELAFAGAQLSPQPRTTPAPQRSSGGCYVATAVYESYDCPEVRVLRRFRDQTLLPTAHGRLFVRLYYRVSPTAVRVGGPLLRRLARYPLDRLIERLRARGISGAPYVDSTAVTDE